MTRLVCRSCGATWLSEPSALLIQRHDGTCLRCDGPVERESENEETLRRYLDAVNARDEDAMAETLDPDVMISPAPRLAATAGLSPETHGIPAAIETFQKMKQYFPDWLFSLDRIGERPDGSLVCVGSRRLVDTDGSSEPSTFFWTIRMRDRHVAELCSYDGRRSAAARAELIP